MNLQELHEDKGELQIDWEAFGKAAGLTQDLLFDAEGVRPSWDKFSNSEKSFDLFFTGRTGSFLSRLKAELKNLGVKAKWKAERESAGNGAYNLVLTFPMDIDYKAFRKGYLSSIEQPDGYHGLSQSIK